MVNLAQMATGVDVSGPVSWPVWRERAFFCTFNETLLFLGWREAKLARTSGPTESFDVMHFGYAFSTKHIKIRGGVKGVIYGILVVLQHGKGVVLFHMPASTRSSVRHYFYQHTISLYRFCICALLFY